jgi:two-component system sensor histidine kinase DesK
MLGSKSQAGWLSTLSARGSPQDDAAVREDDADVREEMGTRTPSVKEFPGGPPLARLIILTVVSGFVTVKAINIASTTAPARQLALEIGIPSIVALFALAVLVTWSGTERWSLPRRLAALTAIALVTFLPLIAIRDVWAGMQGFFAGTALLLLSGWVAWTLYAGAAVIMLVISLTAGYSDYDTTYFVLNTLVVGLVMFGLTRLSQVISYVGAKRDELAQLAVIKERMRFARDLHDLLGYSLSAITLKTELTRRLLDSNPRRAEDEFAEVLDIARQALADVRIVSSGYRNISLAKEASSITALLAATGISTQVEINCGMLEEKVDTVLATVLREAVTNMLRHSTVRNCAIEAGITGRTIWLMVANDGVPRSARSGRDGGGLENLTTRLEAIGGTLIARVRDDGWFDVRAKAPLTPPATMS